MNKTNRERAYRVITENIPEDAFSTIFKFDGVDYTALRDAIERELIEVEKQGMDKGEEMSATKTIWKYLLEPACYLTQIDMPEGAEVLCVQIQSGETFIWAIVELDKPLVSRTFITYGTGEPINIDTSAYIGTYQLLDGALVYHVFEEVTP